MILMSSYQNPMLDPEGELVVFEPLKDSINYKYFTFKDNVITKQNSEADKHAQMIPSALPIPASGKHYYKFVLKKLKRPASIKLGVIAREELKIVNCINGGDLWAVMYCNHAYEATIIEGKIEYSAFSVQQGDTLAVMIDRDYQYIEWHLNGILRYTSKFTGVMFEAESLYLFIQMWNNGDRIECMTE